VLFTPLMAWIIHSFGWQDVYYVMGVIGILLAFLWLKVIHSPHQHPFMTDAELNHIKSGGGLTEMDVGPTGSVERRVRTSACLRELLATRMLVGIYLAQYGITTLTYFFLTWFPVYLIQERGMSILDAGFVASLPALCGLAGGLTGGAVSDLLIRRGKSLSFARKTPIVIGLLLSTSIVACIYLKSDALVVTFMALAFFGKGVGALGWAIVSDTSPPEAAGLSGGLFNMFGNIAGITTPIVIGYLVSSSGSFSSALVFVGLNAALAVICYLFIVGDIRRVKLKSSLIDRPAI
jgi:ACS family glucarate transporter-like MFS transporter